MDNLDDLQRIYFAIFFPPDLIDLPKGSFPQPSKDLKLPLAGSRSTVHVIEFYNRLED